MMELLKNKKSKKIIHWCGVVAACSATLAHAEEAEAEQSPWSGEVEVGFVDSNGNTNTTTLNGGAEAIYQADVWKNKTEFEILKTEEDDETTAEKWFIADKLDYSFAKKDYAFAYARYDEDEFDGFDYQFVASLGYGRKVIDEEKMSLSFEVGPGYRLTEVEDGDDENETIFRASVDYRWEITPGATFKQELDVEAGDDATVTRSVTSLQAKIVGSLAMKASISFENTSEVPEGVDETDRKTALTLVYGF